MDNVCGLVCLWCGIVVVVSVGMCVVWHGGECGYVCGVAW